MAIVLNITAETAEELTETVLELARIKSGAATAGGPSTAEQSVEELLDILKKKLLPQGLTVVVKNNQEAKALKSEPQVNIIPDANGAEPEPAEETEEDEAKATLPAPKKKSGGATKLPKEAARAALSETPAARKARCIAVLQAMFNADKKKAVAEILSKYGDGVKTFASVPEAAFADISDALAAME